jgi:hypothetical protein
MNLALLGTDDDVLALAAAALAGGHTITWLGDVRPQDAAPLAQLVPGVTPEADWEALLGQGIAEAVVVGHGTADDALRAEQLKRLVTDAVPLLVVHPAGSSVLTYYELDMGRREIHSVLRHYNPMIGSPSAVELAAWAQSGSGEIGTVHQIVCQRFANDCGRDALLPHLARDAELLRSIAGEVRTASAVGPQPADASYASLQTQMTTAGSATVRWSATPTGAPSSHAELTLIGERGTKSIRLPAADWSSARAAIEGLAAAVPANGTARSEAVSNWHHATAAMEIVDAILLSLEKGRTIEVHPQRLTHELAFRGTMSAFGCGLLVLAFLVLVAVGVLGGMETFLQQPLVSFWPWALLGLLAVFLLLQIVPWLVTKRPPPATSDEPPASEPP